MIKEKWTLKSRFEDKIVLRNGHAIWTGARSGGIRGKQRRPQISYQGKPIYATHAAWFLATGEWPIQFVLHKPECGKERCVKFEHLYQGMWKENNQDTKIANNFGKSKHVKT